MNRVNSRTTTTANDINCCLCAHNPFLHTKPDVPRRAQRTRSASYPAMNDIFVVGKFWISVQVTERIAFVLSPSLRKVLEFVHFLKGSHGLTPIGIT